MHFSLFSHLEIVSPSLSLSLPLLSFLSSFSLAFSLIVSLPTFDPISLFFSFYICSLSPVFLPFSLSLPSFREPYFLDFSIFGEKCLLCFPPHLFFSSACFLFPPPPPSPTDWFKLERRDIVQLYHP